MLARGDLAPEFEAQTSSGQTVRLSSLRGAPVILYFFPKSGTVGCTRESLGFAELYPAVQPLGVRVLGISVDDTAAQARFASNCSLPFPLVSDSDKEIARQYGVLGAFGLARRVTFVLDPELRVTEVIDSLLPGAHLRRVRERFQPGAPPPPDRRTPPASA